MTAEIQEKIKALSDWYDDLITKYRLLITVEGSDNLVSLMMKSTVVDIYKENASNHSIVFTNETFGLFQMVFDGNKFNSKLFTMMIKTFTEFQETKGTYMRLNFGTSNAMTRDLFRHEYFNSSDRDVLEKVFVPVAQDRFTAIKHLIQDAYIAKENLIHSRVCSITQDETISADSPISTTDLYAKFKKELENDFFEKHSVAFERSSLNQKNILIPHTQKGVASDCNE